MTLTRRIKCIYNDHCDQLLHKSENFAYYSIALDTLKDFTDTEQMAVFIQGVMPDFRIYEKRYISRTSVYFIGNINVPSNLFGVATNGCPFMLGRIEDFQGLINKWCEENALDPLI